MDSLGITLLVLSAIFTFLSPQGQFTAGIGLAFSLVIPFAIVRIMKRHRTRMHGKIIYGTVLFASILLFFLCGLQMLPCGQRPIFGELSCGVNFILVFIVTVIWALVALLLFLMHARR